jgi:NAD-dependent SIR2 family protein deacetylase
MDLPKPLIEAAKHGKAVLFAGAGISNQPLAVSSADLKQRASQEIRKRYRDYDDGERSLEDVLDEFVAVYDREALVRLLENSIPRAMQPASGHLAAVRVFRTIITTNWDLLFEAAFQRDGRAYQRVICEADLEVLRGDLPVLIKMHGTVDQAHTIICTTEDFECYYDIHSAVADYVKQLLFEHTILFVGYGLHDEHVRRLLTMVRRERVSWKQPIYAVGFFDTVRTRLLESRRITVIQADAAAFLETLALHTSDSKTP